MKKNAGIFTAVAVVLAFLGLSSLPKSSPSGSASSAAADKPKTSPKPKAPVSGKPSDGCEEILSRLRPLVDGNVLGTDSVADLGWTLPESCYEAAPNAVERKEDRAMEYLIATVPNPISTHLPLSFDRIVEIIQQAAQDNGYEYESSWLPWNEAKEYSGLSDELTEEGLQDEQEKQPGVLVFRNPYGRVPAAGGEGGLVVFLVSELPTGGIQQQEFANAMAWMRQLGGLSRNPEIKILGPNFSGSLVSLYRSMQFGREEFVLGQPKFTVFSGSVTSTASNTWFKEMIANFPGGTFRTAMEGDSTQIERFCSYVHSQGYPTDRIAILSEDETAFGGANPGTDQKTDSKTAARTDRSDCLQSSTKLYYPRDIATLRSAYEAQSIFSSTNQGASNNTATTTLRGDLSEPANSKHDTVRSYGGQLTPLAQESVLLDITDVLQERKAQFVVVRSTNSLDQIFLARFLRQTVPEIRIVLGGADLLFRRGEEGSSLRGVMILSTYPLLTWQQDWTSTRYPKLKWWQKVIPPAQTGGGGNYRIFGEDNAQGIYIAGRELILDQSVLAGRNPLLAAGYAPPAWARSPKDLDEDQRPATWLTVIGHRQFWPVAVLNRYTLSECLRNCGATASSEESLLPLASKFEHLKFDISGDARPLGHLPIEFGVLVALCLSWSVVHLLWCMRGSISPAPRLFRLAYFAPIPRSQQAVLIGLGTTVVASVAVIVASASGLLRWALGNWNLIMAACLLLAFAIALLGSWCNFRLPAMIDREFDAADMRKWRRISTIGSRVFLVVLILIELALLGGLCKANMIPAFWRSVHLSSGVSPLLPQLFLLAGMYCWFWFALRGLSLFGDDRAVLPFAKDLKLADGTKVLPMFSREEAGEPTEKEAMPLGPNYRRYFILILPTVALACTLALREQPWLRTFGERAFGLLIFFWIIAHISLILTDTAQCWATWRRLRILLNHIDLLALRRTLNALQGMSWSSVWAMSGDVLGERYCLISRQLEALRHLRNQMNKWTPIEVSESKAKAELGKRIDGFLMPEPSDPANGGSNAKLGKFVTWYENSLNDQPVDTVEPLSAVQEEMASIAGLVMGTVLLPAWRRETQSLIIDRTPKPKNETEGTRPPGIYPEMPGHVLAGEEFFVLPYLGFIRNILARIRTVIWGSLCLFVATTLAMSSYPFDPLPVLGGIFLAVFVITGTTVVMIYAAMHRDATLSYVTDTSPGELGGEFWKQVLTFGVGPLIGLLTTLFPSITDFVVSWLQPSAQVIK